MLYWRQFSLSLSGDHGTIALQLSARRRRRGHHTADPQLSVAGPKSEFEELDVLDTVLDVPGLILFHFTSNQGPSAR